MGYVIKNFICFEPFIGGGAFFFELYRRNKIKSAYISDLNQELIDSYLAVRDHVKEVTHLLETYPHDKDFFYELRAKDPWQMELPERAARMIYLNKTCYNGLYRVNSKGKFNVPFGRYKSPKYYDPENLDAVSAALKNVEIECAPFETVIEKACNGDFVYFDPPYAPLSETAYFTSYHANGFSQHAQKKLRDVCLQLTKQNVNVMVSNSTAPIIRRLYSCDEFSLGEVKANRAVNSNPAKRGKLSEFIITNYPFERTAQMRLLEQRYMAYAA